MIGVLLKKQFTEIFKSYFYDMRKNRTRSTVSTVICFLLFGFLMIFVMGVMFGSLAFGISAIIGQDLGWLYYAVMGALGVLFGVFGSVFSTYSGLYLAKDNDLLLSLPIPVRTIMLSRIAGVYLMGLLYSAVVTVPAIGVRFFLYMPNAQNVAGALFFVILISFFVLTLSCLFGYVIAKISLKLKNKSFITVIISLLFMFGYYFLYFNAKTFIAKLVENAAEYGKVIKEKAYFVYIAGAAGEGEIVPLLIVIAVVAAALFLTLYVISRSFLKIAANAAAVPKSKKSTKEAGKHSALGALVLREFKRFTSSPLYMLNCGLGTVLMFAAGVLLLIKGGELKSVVASSYSGWLYIGAVAAASFMISMNDIAAPSVSLEGKTLWQVRALPVSTKTVLISKLLPEMLISVLPALFFAVCAVVVLKPDAPTAVSIILLTLASVVFYALFDLYCGLHKVNLNWTNEMIPIKQGVNILFAIFGAWGVVLVLALPYLLLGTYIPAWGYMTVQLLILAAVSLLLYLWIVKRGVRIFESL